LDYITRLIGDVAMHAPEKIREIFQEFKKEARREWFDSPDELRQYYSQPENFEWLEKGNYGKMNSKYILKVILEAREDFEKYLYETAVNFNPVTNSKKDTIREILDFLSLSIIDFNKEWAEICREKNSSFNYDVLEWRKLNYIKNLENLFQKEKINLAFYLPVEQEEALKKSLKQYDHPNKNTTLRKMSEFMDIRDFFYQVKLTTR
jgi:hypothetical protein